MKASARLSAADSSPHLRRLDNGLTVVVIEEPWAPLVGVQVWLQSGSRHDPVEQAGVAHLLEHLLFRGTERVPDGEFDLQMEALGAQINAATWLDFTQYTSTLPPSGFDEALALERDRLQFLHIEPKIFASEREVVRNERRQQVDDEPDARIDEAFWDLIFEGPYGVPTIGFDDSIIRIDAASAKRFYQAAYRPERAALFVAGPLEASRALDAVSARFGSWRVDAEPVQERPTRLRPPGRVYLREDIASSRILYAWPAPAKGSDAEPVYELLAACIAGCASSPLSVALEIDSELALGVDAAYVPLAQHGLLTIEVTVRRGVEADRVDDEVRRVVAGLFDDGNVADLVARARTSLAVDDRYERQTVEGRTDALGEHWALTGDLVLAGQRARGRAAVTTEMLRDALAGLTPERGWTVIARPEDQ